MNIEKMMYMENVEGDGRGLDCGWERVKGLVERDNKLNGRGIIDEEELLRRWESYKKLDVDWVGIRNIIYDEEGDYWGDCFILECIWYRE